MYRTKKAAMAAAKRAARRMKGTWSPSAWRDYDWAWELTNDTVRACYDTVTITHHNERRYSAATSRTMAYGETPKQALANMLKIARGRLTDAFNDWTAITKVTDEELVG